MSTVLFKLCLLYHEKGIIIDDKIRYSLYPTRPHVPTYSQTPTLHTHIHIYTFNIYMYLYIQDVITDTISIIDKVSEVYLHDVEVDGNASVIQVPGALYMMYIMLQLFI